jgi:hypothetical protein
MERAGRARCWPKVVLALGLATLLMAGFVQRVPAGDAPFPNDPLTVRSQSGQFIVHGLPMNPALAGFPTSAVQYIRLDPNLTAVSLERIRQAIRAELEWPDQWQGLIHVVTEPVRGENTRVTIVSQRFDNGWSYRVMFPEIVDRNRFISAAVKVILLEFANRRAPQREADLPAWLVEGLSAKLVAQAVSILALEPAAEVNRRDQNPDPLAVVRAHLRQREALSFDDLSMPTEEVLGGADGVHFRSCAHLFVHELLRLRDGRACLRRMLERLPENLNWQTTFLQSFDKHFARLLDVARWYSLNVASVRGRDPASILPPIATLQQLDSLLATPVEVRTAAKELPLRLELKLQRVIREWDYPRQHPVLVEKIGRLQTLRGRAAPEMATLVAGYTEALIEYVGRRNLIVPPTDRQRERVRPKGEAARVLQQLDALDARRAAISGGASR